MVPMILANVNGVNHCIGSVSRMEMVRGVEGGNNGGSHEGRRGGGSRGERGGRMETSGGRGGVTEPVDEVVGMDLVQYKSMLANDECTARKRLVTQDGTITVRGQPVPNLAGKVAGTVMLLENGGLLMDPMLQILIQHRANNLL